MFDFSTRETSFLDIVVAKICQYVQLPLLHKDLFSSGLRKRSGVLLYGPPGTGKVGIIFLFILCKSTLI